MAFHAYVLLLADGHYYAGHTDSLESRLAAHELGLGSDYTARRRPLKLVWSQEFPTREEALAAERIVKGWTRAKKEALITGNWELIRWLSFKVDERPDPPAGTPDPD